LPSSVPRVALRRWRPISMFATSCRRRTPAPMVFNAWERAAEVSCR
jgi:hypothetical protein